MIDSVVGLSRRDQLIAAFGRSLAVLSSAHPAVRPNPAQGISEPGEPLAPEEARLAGALMRVNHVGEICAQALYEGQAAVARNPAVRSHLLQAADEEADHLAWTRARLDELGARASLLNPLWYLGAFAIGVVAGQLGDKVSLGFVAETENQVERHLEGHLERLPERDARSRAIVAQMKNDEARHGSEAIALGASELPLPVGALMRLAARVMTGTAHYI